MNDPPDRPNKKKLDRIKAVGDVLSDKAFVTDFLALTRKAFRRIEPNDSTQDTFLRMLERQEQYRGEPSPKDVKAWAYSISKNRHIDHIRGEKVRFEKTSLLKQPERSGENVLQRLALKEAMDKLNCLQRQILRLYTDKDYPKSVEMIADKLALKTQRVRNELTKIKRQLVKAIEELDI